MHNLKKYIVVLCLILFVVLSILLIGINNLRETIKKQQPNENETEKTHTESTFTDIKDYKTYYTVKEIINNYIMSIKEINGDQYIENGKMNMTAEQIREALQEEGIQSIKGVLDKQYIEDISINEDEIKLAQNKYKQNGTYDKEILYNLNIEKMLVYNMNKNINIILVNANLNNEELKLLIKLDSSNKTYSIFLEDYIEKYKYSENINKENIKINKDVLVANEYNKYMEVDASETYIISQYFSEYRMKMINDSQKAYELLDTEYKQEKFGSYENFINYVKNNMKNISYASIEKYQINKYSDIKEYICIDQNGKYYIFLEKGVGDYKVVLDTYTIDLPEFLQKYNSNNSEIKTGLNIQKIFDAINDGGYNYAYKKLDTTFKQNNFPTEEAFKNYAQQYFLSNKIKHDKCEKSGELCIYEISITQQNNNILKKTFVVKLLEGTDFVFSFDI